MRQKVNTIESNDGTTDKTLTTTSKKIQKYSDDKALSGVRDA